MSETTPTIRVRINHTKTIKNGWQHETTVEMTFGHGNGDPWIHLGEYYLKNADAIGRAESDRRTALDQQEGTNAHD